MNVTVTQALPSPQNTPVPPLAASQDDAFQRWYAAGETQANAGAYDRALRCFEEATILAPEDLDALVYQAVCLIHLEQPQRALAVAEQILAIAPRHPQGWLYQGVALHRLGRYQEAYASYAQVPPPAEKSPA